MHQEGRAYRNELKYLINFKEYLILKTRLKSILRSDSNGSEYLVRSLYFDELSDTAYREKLDGIDEREKYRIRIYNYSDSVIKLERKIKKGDLISKDSVSISREVLDSIMSNCYNPHDFMEEELLRIFYTKLKKDCLRPRVIVEYLREAFVYPLENVRITFDRNLVFPMNELNLFDKSTDSRSILPPSTLILEVKFNRFLPEFIKDILQINSSNRMSISKYMLCRANNLYKEGFEWMEL